MGGVTWSEFPAKKHKNTQNTWVGLFFALIKKTQKHIEYMGVVTWSNPDLPEKHKNTQKTCNSTAPWN